MTNIFRAFANGTSAIIDDILHLACFVAECLRVGRRHHRRERLVRALHDRAIEQPNGLLQQLICHND